MRRWICSLALGPQGKVHRSSWQSLPRSFRRRELCGLARSVGPPAVGSLAAGPLAAGWFAGSIVVGPRGVGPPWAGCSLRSLPHQTRRSTGRNVARQDHQTRLFGPQEMLVLEQTTATALQFAGRISNSAPGKNCRLQTSTSSCCLQLLRSQTGPPQYQTHNLHNQQRKKVKIKRLLICIKPKRNQPPYP